MHVDALSKAGLRFARAAEVFDEFAHAQQYA
jgi:hypothetical protein